MRVGGTVGPVEADGVVPAEADPRRQADRGSHRRQRRHRRTDLLALAKPPTIEEAARRMQIMAGLVSMLSRDPRLADAANQAIVEPGTAVHRALLHRAVQRGEIRADCDIETISLIVPSMTAYHALVLRKPVNRAFLVSLTDRIVLPAVGLRAG